MQAARANPPSAAAAPAAAAAAAGSCSARTRERSQKARSPATGACSMPSRHRTSSLAPASNPPLFSRRGPEAPSGVRTWLQNTIRNRISDFGRVREDGLKGEGKLFDLLSSRLPLPPPDSHLRSLASPLIARHHRPSGTPPERPRRLLHGPIGGRAGLPPVRRLRPARGRVPEELRQGAVRRDHGGGVRLGSGLELDARD